MLNAKLLTGFMLATGLLVAPCQANEIRLRLNIQRPVSKPLKQTMLAFKRELELRDKNSSMKVDIQEQPSAVSGQTSSQPSASAIEIAMSPMAEFAGQVPAAGLFSLPFLFNFDAIVYAAGRPDGEIRKLLDAELEKAGNRVLWWQPYGSTVIFSKGKPILNPQQLAGHKIVVFENNSAEFIRICGGTPILNIGSDPLGFSRKEAVNAFMSTIYSLEDYTISESVDTINNIGYSANLFIAILKKDSWRSLTPQQQKIITEAARTAEESGWEQSAQAEAEAYDQALQKGLTIETITADDTLGWRSCSSSMIESFLNRTEQTGAKLLAAYGKLRSDPCCSQALQTQTND